MIALEILLAVALYTTIGAGVGRYLNVRFKRKCDRCSSPHRTDCYGDHMSPCVVSGILWPLAGFFFLGIIIADWFSNQDSRTQRKDKAKTLEHERKMAEIRAQEASFQTAMEYLKTEGIKV